MRALSILSVVMLLFAGTASGAYTYTVVENMNSPNCANWSACTGTMISAGYGNELRLVTNGSGQTIYLAYQYSGGVGNDTYYYLNVWSGGIQLYVNTSSQFMNLTSVSYSLPANAVIRAIWKSVTQGTTFVGNQIIVYVNNSLAFSYLDSGTFLYPTGPARGFSGDGGRFD